MSTSPETLQNLLTHPVYGMGQFPRWWYELAEKISPTDIDGYIQSDHIVAGRHLFLEFKAPGESMRSRDNEGQLRSLTALSRLPRTQVLVVFDPYNLDPSSERMDMTKPVRAQFIREGVLLREHWTTMGAISQNCWDWVWNKGKFAEKVVDYTKRIDELIDLGYRGEGIRIALGLPPMTVPKPARR